MMICTLGYQLRDIGEYVDELRAAGVDVVVDVRETPWSRKPGFSKARLSKALQEAGIRYVHARFAGNPKKLRREAASHAECLASYSRYLDENPEILSRFRELLEGDPEARICLLCYERHPEDCHRSVLLEKLTSRLAVSLKVKHLGVAGAPRFV